MLSVCIQAGGASTRMGTDKALIPFNGQPLVERLLTRFRPIAAELFIVSNHPANFQNQQVVVYSDLRPGVGALGGLYTALTYAKFDLLALIACDLPFANPNLIAWMAEQMADPELAAIYPKPNGFYEPVHAVYRPSVCLPRVEEAINRGDRKLISWIEEVPIAEVPEQVLAHFDPLGRTFINVNTPQEFSAAELLESQSSTG